MFQDADKKQIAEKDVLAGEMMEGEVAEEMKDSPARRRWVALVWTFTFWLPNPVLTWVGRMKRIDVRQAWREKLAINMLIWFICACTVFVVAVLGDLICPTEHVYSPGELQSHSMQNDANNVFGSIRGEVFDLSQMIPSHLASVSVVPRKNVLMYGGADMSDLFPVQVCLSIEHS